MDEYDNYLDYIKTGKTHDELSTTLAFYNTKPTKAQLTTFRKHIQYVVRNSLFMGGCIGFVLGIFTACILSIIGVV